MNKLAEQLPQNDATIAIMDELAIRKRHRDRSDLRKMFNRLELKYGRLNRDQFMQTFKKLQDLGFGSIIEGRGTQPTRFAWAYNLRDVTKALKGSKKIKDLKPLHEVEVKPVWVKPLPEVKETLETVRILVVDKNEHSISRYEVDGPNKALVLELLGEFCQQVK